MVRNALDSIKELTGKDIDLQTINYEDKNVYDMLSRGDVSGVFQISAQSGKVMEQKPRNFRDLIAINAIIRPGTCDFNEYIARRGGKEWYAHPNRQSYMNETHGLMIYQEQFLLDCKVFAGWDIAYADKHVRKNKNLLDDEELRIKFFNDSLSNGYKKEEIESVWHDILMSAGHGYNFCKAHSSSYAMLSYQTAWLKYYYPTHFYASLMTIEGDDQDAISGYISECKDKGIKILPPDANESRNHFIPTSDGIRYRITTIKNVGDNAIKWINKNRPFASYEDFLNRKVKKYINKRCVQYMVKAGCFDYDNDNRAELMWLYDMSERTKTQVKQEHECDKYEWNDKVKSEWEKEALGMYLSIHPMEKYGFKPLSSYQDGGTCLCGGEVLSVAVIRDKNDKEMAFVTLDTLFGNIKVIVFSSIWKEPSISNFMLEGNITMVRGKRSGNDVLLNSMEVLEE